MKEKKKLFIHGFWYLIVIKAFKKVYSAFSIINKFYLSLHS